MALSVKSDEADRLARELARLTGETLTDAIIVSLRERLERQRSGSGVGDRVRRLVGDLGAFPVLDTRLADGILGYDDDGLPR